MVREQTFQSKGKRSDILYKRFWISGFEGLKMGQKEYIERVK